MFHQTDEERQVLGFHPFLVEGEDMLAADGAQQEVGILDPFGGPLEWGHFADVVKRDKVAQRIVRDFGVDSHVPSVERPIKLERWRSRLTACIRPVNRCCTAVVGLRVETALSEFRALARSERTTTVECRMDPSLPASGGNRFGS